MAGKAYSMREMRAIVEYLNERKAYGELKGRKMWMEFANSDKTTRTWQSLKETFLKRILPDIQNPYYKLTMDQMRSFKEGIDVAEREKNNRLEFRTATTINLDAEGQKDISTKDNEVPTTSLKNDAETCNITNEPSITSIHDELEKTTGENVTAARIPSRCRSSVETLVLDTYENAEEIQRELESPPNKESEGKSKSLKDMLTFEPMTPMTPLVQDLLDDFETESEASDKEPQLHIVEDPQIDITESDAVSERIKLENMPSENDVINNEADSTIEINDSENTDLNVPDSEMGTTTDNNTSEKDNTLETNNAPTAQLLKPDFQNAILKHNGNEDADAINPQENNIEPPHEFVVAETSSKENIITKSSNKTGDDTFLNDPKKNESNNTIPNTGNSTQNTSSDTVIPNNQEALNKSNNEIRKSNNENVEETDKKSKKSSVKRFASKDSKVNKILKKDNHKPEEVNNVETPPVIETLNTPTEEDTQAILFKNTLQVNTSLVEITNDASATNNTEDVDALKTTISENINKPDTSAEKEISETVTVKKKRESLVRDKNPCLMSVSLYEEQFNNTKYSSDSDVVMALAVDQTQFADKSDTVTNKKTKIGDNAKEAKKNKEVEVITKKELEQAALEDKENKAIEIINKKVVEQAALEDKETEVLDSSEDKESENQRLVNQNNRSNKSVNLRRERAIANVFGFAHDAGASCSRKRNFSHRRKSHLHHRRRRDSMNIDSNTSEWTSESDNESYISPPRGRKNRHTKKYLKPTSARILQDPDEGMVFVLFGKHVYPLVKDGKHIKNFLNYRHDSGSEGEESYWKQKYIEEKQKVEEVKKLLKNSQTGIETQTHKSINSISSSPLKNNKTSPSNATIENSKDKAETPKSVIENTTEPKEEKMILKIAAKNGVEYCLEGGWNQINNVMPQVVKMVHFESNNTSNGMSKPVSKGNVDNPPKLEAHVMDLTSSGGELTPVLADATFDPEVSDRVNKIESQIFSEIEALDKEDMIKQKEIERTNVTTRKKVNVLRKDSLSLVASTSKSPAKRARTSKTNSMDSNPEIKPVKSRRVRKPKLDKPEKSKPNDVDKQITESIAKSPDNKPPEESVNKETAIKMAQQLENNAIVKPRSRSSFRLSRQRELSEQKSDASIRSRVSVRQVRTPVKLDIDLPVNDAKQQADKPTTKPNPVLCDFDDEDVRFMFPPMGPAKANKNTMGKKNRSLPTINVMPPQEMSAHSIDSMQGYLDSNSSPFKIMLPKRKRKVSFTARKRNDKRLSRRRSYPMLQALSSDSNQSAYFVPQRKTPSGFNSEMYTSDSFQMCNMKYPLIHLARIDEMNPQVHKSDTDIRHFSSVSRDANNSGGFAELGSSSNVSLPISPELSVVENLSISREMIRGDNNPTLNEILQNKSSGPMDYTDFMISNLDVSVPLMNQQCSVQKTTSNVISAMRVNESDAIQLRDCTVDLTMSETLDQRLRDLLLESAKKMSRVEIKQDTPMDVDKTPVVTAKKTRGRTRKINVDMAMDVDKSKVETTKITKASKRSSTPRKKKVTVTKAKHQQNPAIEEEHKESCSYAGRNSFPPTMAYIPIDENANNCSDVKLPPKSKKKKDIIKVKIQRPSSRSPKETRPRSSGRSGSAVSNCTDSGINDTESKSTLLLKDIEDSIQLIHNHSETCLLANECLGSNSVELIENSVSIISLGSSRHSEDSVFYRMLEQENVALSEETTISQEQTASDRALEDVFETADAEYHTPILSNCSLITEDLTNSPPSQPSKWYLLDEDVTNTESASKVNSFGSNLKQIFPIACAVPNLSTISEMSKENEDSRKADLDSLN